MHKGCIFTVTQIFIVKKKFSLVPFIVSFETKKLVSDFLVQAWWEVVKNSASPKNTFFFLCHFPLLGRPTHEHHYHFQSKKRGHSYYTCIFIFLKTTHPTLIQGGGGEILRMHIHFPMGPCPSLAQKGEACA